MEKRVHVFYSGTVQGVFFRSTSKEIADEFGVKGWVRNLSDGRVELAAEAEEEALHRFLGKVKATFGAYIRKEDTKWDDSLGEFTHFRIDYTR